MSNRWLSRFSTKAWSIAIATGLAAAGLAPAQPAAPDMLTVRHAAELALERAPHLAAMRAAREEGSAAARIAADALHPSVWISTTPGYSTGLPTVVAGSVPAYGKIEVRQTIYDPWKKNEVLQAQASAAGIQAAFEDSCAETVRAVVAAYARCWTDERLAEAARQRVASAEAAVRRASALLEEGRSTEIDVERSRLEAARAKQKLLNAESDRELDGLELKRLVGWPGSAPLRLSSETESVLADVTAVENLEAARGADPQLKALGRQIELLGRSADVASKRWPVIEASVQYQYLPSYYEKYYNSFNQNDFSFGVFFAIPLWAGGRLDDTEAKARASMARAEADRAARESDLEVAVRRAEAAVARAEAAYGLARRSRGIAEQDLRAAQLLSREGRGAAGDVDEKTMRLSDAEEEAARASLGALEERVRLLSLRGDLARTLLGSEPPCAANAGS